MRKTLIIVSCIAVIFTLSFNLRCRKGEMGGSGQRPPWKRIESDKWVSSDGQDIARAMDVNFDYIRVLKTEIYPAMYDIEDKIQNKDYLGLAKVASMDTVKNLKFEYGVKNIQFLNDDLYLQRWAEDAQKPGPTILRAKWLADLVKFGNTAMATKDRYYMFDVIFFSHPLNGFLIAYIGKRSDGTLYPMLSYVLYKEPGSDKYRLDFDRVDKQFIIDMGFSPYKPEKFAWELPMEMNP